MKIPDTLEEASNEWVKARNSYLVSRRLAQEANIREALARQEMRLAHEVYQDLYEENILPKVKSELYVTQP